MEIQKIFSSYDDYGYEDERLYSVLMDEDEIRMFASVQAIANKMSKNAWVQKQGRNALETHLSKQPSFLSNVINRERDKGSELVNLMEVKAGRKAVSSQQPFMRMSDYRNADINTRINYKSQSGGYPREIKPFRRPQVSKSLKPLK